MEPLYYATAELSLPASSACIVAVKHLDANAFHHLLSERRVEVDLLMSLF